NKNSPCTTEPEFCQCIADQRTEYDITDRYNDSDNKTVPIPAHEVCLLEYIFISREVEFFRPKREIIECHQALQCRQHHPYKRKCNSDSHTKEQEMYDESTYTSTPFHIHPSL